jgi:hypothetical protein
MVLGNDITRPQKVETWLGFNIGNYVYITDLAKNGKVTHGIMEHESFEGSMK